ncbi:MAG: phage holin family protein [Proteobacteria bacterium]|nr:phage holin family protein [Pseudomonadota bacterium]
MVGLVIRLAIGALGLWLSARLVTGIQIDDNRTLIAAALLLGIVNALVRPVVVFLTLPITIVTLGLFLLVVNALMFALVAWLLPGFSVSGLIPAALGTAIVGIVSWLGSQFVGPKGRFEVMVVQRRRDR